MTLRDFNSSSDDRPVILNTDPVGNAGGLGNFHTVSPEEREPNNMPKILGGLVVALMLGGAGAYIYSVSGQAQPKQQVVASNQQLPTPPAAQPAPMPASDTNTAATPAPAPMPAADNTPAAEPKATPVRSASVKKSTRTASSSARDAGAAQARMSADSTPAVQPQQQAVVEPVSPQPPASSVASAGTLTNPEVAPAQTPPADNSAPAASAPAQVQQPATTPAPATPDAQPAPPPAQ